MTRLRVRLEVRESKGGGASIAISYWGRGGGGGGAVMLSNGFGRRMARIFAACYMMFVPLNKLFFPDVGLTLNGIACSLVD